MKKILIALDYNPTAQKVAEAGYALAKDMKAEVILFHAIADSLYYYSLQYSPIMGYNGLNDTDPAQIINETNKLRKSAQLFLDKSKQHLADVTIQTIIGEGEFSESIIQTAKDEHVDIVVMGSHCRSGLDRILMGSIAEKVLYHITIPVFIIPTREDN